MIEKLKRMRPEEINKIIEAFIAKMKEDQETLKKIALCFGLAVVFVIAGQQANTHLQSSVTKAIEKRDEYKNIQTFLEAYQKDAKDFKEGIAKVTGKILDEKDLDKSMVYAQKLAEANGVQITSTQRADKSSSVGQGVQSQTVKLSLSGTYGGIMQFMNGIENASFFASIDSLTIRSENKDKKTNNDDIITATIDYTVFFSKQGKEDNKK